MLKQVYKASLILLTLILFLSCNETEKEGALKIPDPARFTNQIQEFKSLAFDSQRDRIVFTGSSSIRGWKDIQSYYPDHQIINTGFGGSQMTDLHYFLEDAILRFEPSKVFIYEGDNDLNAGLDPQSILTTTKKVVEGIRKKFPVCQIVLIAAKPSLARWDLKNKYLTLNEEFRAYADTKSYVDFADVWDVMLNNNAEPIKYIFLEDGLHMNKSGYDLWDLVIKPLIDH